MLLLQINTSPRKWRRGVIRNVILVAGEDGDESEWKHLGSLGSYIKELRAVEECCCIDTTKEVDHCIHWQSWRDDEGGIAQSAKSKHCNGKVQV